MGFKWYHILIFAVSVLSLAVLSLPREREHGIMLKNAGKYNLAEPILLEQHSKKPYDERIVIELADLYQKSNEPEKGIRILESFFAKHPGNFNVRKALLNAYTATFNFDKAIKLLEATPESLVDEKLLLALYESAGYLEQAVKFHKTKMQNNKTDLIRWQEIERMQRWRMDIAGVIEALKNIIRIEGKIDSMVELLHVYSWKGMEGNALKLAEKIEEEKDVKPRDLRVVKAVYLRQKILPKAVAVAEKICMNKGKTNPQDWLDLAALKQWGGDLEDSLAAIERGLKVFDKNIMMLRQAANLAFRMEKHLLSGNYMQQIAEITDKEEDWRLAAKAYNDAGEFKLADSILVKLDNNREIADETMLLKATVSLNLEDKSRAEILAKSLSERITSSDRPDPLLITQAAMLFSRLDNPEMQAELLSRISGLENSNPDLMINLATAYGALGNPQKGIEVLEKIKGNENVDMVEVRKELAWLKYQLAGKLANNQPELKKARAQAAEAFEASLADNENRDMALALTELYLQMDMPKKARELIARYGASSPEMSVDLAASYIRSGMKESAQEILAKIGEPENLPAGRLSHLAYLHGLLGNKGIAVKFLEKALQKDPANRDIRLALADAYGEAGDFEKQYSIIDQLALEGGEADWLAAADRRLWNNDRKGELQVLIKAREKFPESIALLARQMSALAFLGETDKAKELKNELLSKADFADTSTQVTIAESLLTLEEYSLARKFFNKAYQEEKENPQILIGLARANRALNNRELAAKYYSRFLTINNSDLQAWYELGDMKSEAGLNAELEFGRAKKLLSGASREDRHSMLARIYFREGKIRKSIQEYKKAIKVTGEDLSLAADLAEVYISELMYDRALSAISISLNKNPKDTRLNQILASIYSGKGEYKKARSVLRELYEKNPQDVNIIVALAYIEDYMRNSRTAENMFARAEEIMEAAR